MLSKKNVEQTIGVPYEIIAIENKGQMGICQLYNIGAQRARYEFLCFAHEDILVHTSNWGEKVIELFRATPDMGLLGVAGGKYKAYTPSGWSFASGNTELQCINFIQANKNAAKPSFKVLINEDGRSLSRVASLDGLWLCTRKIIASDFPFDEKTFKGFHGYDIDLSLQIGKKFGVYVTYEILIEHFSSGNFDSQWLGETLKLHKKWNSLLPVDVSSLNKITLKEEEAATFRFLLSQNNKDKAALNKICLHLLGHLPKFIRVAGFRNCIRMVRQILKVR